MGRFRRLVRGAVLAGACLAGCAGPADAALVTAERAPEKRWQPLGPAAPFSLRPESEPNDSLRLADPLDCGDVLSPAAISPRKDRDYVVFTANAGDAILVGTDADGVNGQLEDTVVSLFDADGNALASDDDSGPGRYSLLHYTAATAGTYYACIAAFDTLSTGAYRAFLLCSPPPQPNCSVAAYDSVTQVFTEPQPIPDGVTSGRDLGPLSIANDGQYLRDVALALRIEHTYLGDLTATLTYDVECDGTPEAAATVLCRPGRSNCLTGADAGCPANLSCSQTIFLSDAASEEIGLLPWGCGSTDFVIPSACYRPSAAGAPFSTFARLPRGGCFHLLLIDWVTFDSGSVCEWRVYTAASPTAVRSASWSNVKQLFR